jgi:hypothetical protein
MAPTRTDSGATEWRIADEVVQLREWATDNTHRLPAAPVDSLMVGTADSCLFRLVDPSGHTSREHARLERRKHGWIVRDLDSKNGIRIDGARRPDGRLEPGVELGIGRLTLLAESRLFMELRAFLCLLLGWSSDKLDDVDHALRAIRLAATRRVPLVLCGQDDLTQIAKAIHRHALGVLRPFVVSDPRRREGDENVRAPENTESGMAAVGRALGGSLCVWSKRLPRDFTEVRVALRDPAVRVQLIICIDSPRQSKPYCVDPIVIPALKTRSQEIPRIIAEYVDDAAIDLSATIRLNAADRDWVAKYSASSIAEIEKGTRRLLAIRHYDNNVTAASRALGMAPISLFRWVGRRGLPGISSTPSPSPAATPRQRAPKSG